MPARKSRLKNLEIGNAHLVFRNFSGVSKKYNAPGKKNFCILLEEGIAEDLKKDGWNVRWLEPRNADEDRQAYMQVSVSYDYYPPNIFLITASQGKVRLGEKEINILDWAEIETADVVINPYEWEVNGKSGVKAYLKTLYITIIEDKFAAKYVNVPDSAMGSLDDTEPPWDE